MKDSINQSWYHHGYQLSSLLLGPSYNNRRWLMEGEWDEYDRRNAAISRPRASRQMFLVVLELFIPPVIRWFFDLLFWLLLLFDASLYLVLFFTALLFPQCCSTVLEFSAVTFCILLFDSAAMERPLLLFYWMPPEMNPLCHCAVWMWSFLSRWTSGTM